MDSNARLHRIKDVLLSMEDTYKEGKSKEDLLLKQKNDEKKKLEKVKNKQENVLTQKELLERASKQARENGKDLLSRTATYSVQSVLGSHYSVDIELDMKGGVPIADLVVCKEIEGEDEKIITDPTTEEGGGVADICSLSTFTSMGMLVGDSNIAPYFLDEPTKFLSKGNSDKASDLLKYLTDETDRQVIVVTHSPEIAQAGDSIYEVTIDKKTQTSSVTKVG